jgi:hypothetical protein
MLLFGFYFAIEEKSNEDFINFSSALFAAIFQLFTPHKLKKKSNFHSKSIREKFNCAQVQCHLCTL